MNPVWAVRLLLFAGVVRGLAADVCAEGDQTCGAQVSDEFSMLHHKMLLHKMSVDTAEPEAREEGQALLIT